ncbi:MAG: ABC transporter ATP-binding protein [Planctomycetales bacterium]|nr:ABC transporter ATP-binding protein [Planctomycetales bacterium]
MFVEMSNVTFGYGSGAARHEVLRNADLAVAENEFVAVLGFSGSGKSTLMALLAGLLVPDAGEVRFQGQVQPPPGPARGLFFQNYSLLPWLTVFGNIELALRQVEPDLSRAERAERVHHFIDLVNLNNAEWKRPHEMSGGMRQRLALARTLALNPQLLLLDEPLSALDALTRAVLQDELLRIWDQDKRTVIMVTNDIDEAILLADRIVTLTPGPGAAIAGSFPVDLERPRDRETLNFQPEFKTLRNRITHFLLNLNAAKRDEDGDELGPPPEVIPAFAVEYGNVSQPVAAS